MEDFQSFMHGFAASPHATRRENESTPRRRASARGASDARGGGYDARGDGRERDREGDGAGAGAGGRRDPRWASEPVSGQSAAANACVLAFVIVFMPMLRALFRAALLVALGAAFTSNPGRDESARRRCWDVLLDERRRRINERNVHDASNLNVVRMIKNAVNDIGGALQGRRVMVDFVFCSFAYLESESEVDAQFFAVGAFGSWHVVEMSRVRGVVEWAASALDRAVEATGVS